MQAAISKNNLKKIEDTVISAEARISGEIVPIITSISNDYDDSVWFVTTISLIVGFIFGIFLIDNPWHPGYFSFIFSVVLACLSYFVLKFFPKLKCLFLSQSRMHQAVLTKAKLAFLENEIFKTKHRTGILIYTSLAERKVVILGDVGINEKVKQEDWDKIIQNMILEIKKSDFSSALCHAINQAADLLVKHNFIKESDDTNELSDKLKVDR